MSIVVKENAGGKTAPIEAGTYPARCVGVVDIGVQYNEKFAKYQEKVILVFELPTERITVDDADKPRWVSKRYTASLSEKAGLRKDLEAWRGRAFTGEELAGFNLKNILGCACMVSITQAERGGNTYSDIASISKPMKGMEVPPLENEPILFDMDAEDAEEVIEKLPKWMRELAEKSDTWKHRPGTSGLADESELGDGELPF